MESLNIFRVQFVFIYSLDRLNRRAAEQTGSKQSVNICLLYVKEQTLTFEPRSSDKEGFIYVSKENLPLTQINSGLNLLVYLTFQVGLPVGGQRSWGRRPQLQCVVELMAF